MRYRDLQSRILVSIKYGSALASLVAGPSNHVLPIPGTTLLIGLEENFKAASVPIIDSDIERLDGLVNQGAVHGPRYGSTSQLEIDTEEFA